MQQLNPNQLQAISGGVFESATAFGSKLFSDTATAFQKGLTTAEAGVGFTGLLVGAGLGCSSKKAKFAGSLLVASYVAYSYVQPDLSSLTSMFSFDFTSAQDTATTA